MSRRNTLKLVHFASTIWFIVCLGGILVLALRQAGFRWWIIFSLSGHSALLIFLLISLYLFAVFKGVDRSQKIELEHPLTSADYYMFFYVVAPFWGALAGAIGMIGEYTISHFLSGIALGTLGTTFLVWVIVDPIAGLLEMLLPTSRKYRLKRLAQAKARRQNKQRDRERLLREVLEKAEFNQRVWQEMLKPQAERLAGLLSVNKINFKQAEQQAVDIGVKAWQTGGLSCMRQLRDMAMAISKGEHRDSVIIDYISGWWDGIGTWRNPSLG